MVSQGIRFEHLSKVSRELISTAPTLFCALRITCARAHFEDTILCTHLELHGSSLRVCTRLKGTTGLQHLEHAQWLQNILPIEIIRQFINPKWAPETIAFEARYTPSLDVQAQWPKTRFLSGQPTSWIDVPVRYLGLPPAALKLGADSTRINELSSSSQFIESLKMMLPAYLDGKMPTVDDVAEMANISTRSLQRILSDLGSGYRDILNIIKFERAAQLLKDTDIKIIDIALSLGYSDAAHFTRAFKKMTASSPLEFRIFNRISE
ncbi:helix-turn-helix transcriptional regulator [Diaphorobacter sp. HDW4B]|uniref:helix-turn-helix transcriptional regulator n=1 Tax=Diaphorobacter sp. HDW4B TaxID=2714925 RepID=UPI001408EF79|nr:helix-turn-helix transcriptional regulator [Diaphorobacter sp. HDW4B]QIL69134.1 helix-turn-helix transcriptional regulator [Diaphorobacter sp. HDW4B]